MGLLSRIRARFQRPVAAPPEDPRAVLDRAYAEQLDLLQRSRRGLADVATARARLERQAADLQRQADALGEQVAHAVAAGQDALAQSASARRDGLSQQRVDVLRQHGELGAQEEGLHRSVTALAGQVERLRSARETLSAQYSAAEAQATISSALGSTDQVATGLALRAVEDLTIAKRAEAAALEELAGPALLPDELPAPPPPAGGGTAQ